LPSLYTLHNQQLKGPSTCVRKAPSWRAIWCLWVSHMPCQLFSVDIANNYCLVPVRWMCGIAADPQSELRTVLSWSAHKKAC
jgi:hypothetical protein